MILPFNISSIIQLIDENIIINFKKLFQQKLLHQICQYHNGIKKFYINFDLISATWDEITVDIVHLWRKLLNQQNSKIIIKEESE